MREKGVFFDHHGLHEPVIHVPLLFGGAGIPETTVPETVQHIDIAPTICDLVGVEELPGAGESLVPLMQGETTEPPRSGAAFAEERHTRSARMIRRDSAKLVSILDGDGQCRYCEQTHEPPKALYDLKSDPEEASNVFENPDYDFKAQELEKQFEEFRGGLIDPTTTEYVPQPDEADLEERLKHLGYR